jgi:hypothetical protein
MCRDVPVYVRTFFLFIFLHRSHTGRRLLRRYSSLEHITLYWHCVYTICHIRPVVEFFLRFLGALWFSY